jgi:ribose transport system permease protein
MSTTTLSPSLRSWRQRARNTPWLGSALAAAVAFVITIANGQIQGIPGLLAAALSFSALTVLVALGQMLVISTGPGNADLSIPSTIALSSAVSMLVMDGSDAMVLPGLLAAMGVGAAVGLLNFGLIRLLRIPPIIATLANSLIVMSCAISFGRGLKIKPPPIFIELVTLRLGGIPLLALLALAVSVLVWLVVERTVFGRSLCALGQNARAAEFSGVRTVRTSLLAYVICAALAGLTGALIAGFAGGNSLDQGDEYLLLTIAVVVIGGTSVSGGRPCVPGIWGAALFMFLLVAMLNAAGASAGLRMLLTGAIIITVIALAGSGSDRT